MYVLHLCTTPFPMSGLSSSDGDSRVFSNHERRPQVIALHSKRYVISSHDSVSGEGGTPFFTPKLRRQPTHSLFHYAALYLTQQQRNL